LALPLVNTPSEMPEMDIYRTHYRMPELPEPPLPPQVRYKRKQNTLDWGQLRVKQNQQRNRRKKPGPTRIIFSDFAPDDIQLPEGDLSVFFDSDDETVDSGVPGGVEDMEEVFSGSAFLGKGEPMYEKMEPPRWGSIPPKLIKRVEPVYPKIAFRNRIEGNVRMVVLTDIYGRVNRIRVVDGHPFLRKAARDAIRQWVYEPVIINGLPKPVLFVVVVRFRLAS